MVDMGPVAAVSVEARTRGLMGPRLIHDRWIDKYTEHRVSALADLKTELEETA